MSTIARLLRGLLVIVAGIAISTAASTTAASAATFTYDAPALARVDAHASGLAEAEPVKGFETRAGLLALDLGLA